MYLLNDLGVLLIRPAINAERWKLFFEAFGDVSQLDSEILWQICFFNFKRGLKLLLCTKWELETTVQLGSSEGLAADSTAKITMKTASDRTKKRGALGCDSWPCGNCCMYIYILHCGIP